MAMLLEYRNDKADARVVFDDDGRTAYAYLFVDEKIVGDVWLYNVVASPQDPEWRNRDRRDKMPFANPTGFASGEAFDPVRSPTEIALNWQMGSSGRHQVTLFLKGQEHAVLRPGAKPGWCRLAAKPGPLAKPINDAKSV
jgi:hypothetical protein